MCSKTEMAILDFLCSADLPITKDSPNVEWLYTTPRGNVYGITNAQAQTIYIIAERCGEMFCGGHLEYVRGRKFIQYDRIEL
jgi:hypothetical protein